MDLILHITTREEWETAASSGSYHGDTLETDGFIHCSTPSQVIGVANALFSGRQGLVLLRIDPAKVRSYVVYEDCYQTGQKFPHIYGPLNLDAVTKVVDFPPDEDGKFSLPPKILATNYTN